MNDIWNRVRLMLAQARGLVISQHKIQVLGMDKEVLDNVDRVQPYGFSNMPFKDCQAYIVFPNGDRSHGLCLIQGDRRYTLNLANGEVALHDDQGQKVHIMRDRVRIETPKTFEVIADKIDLHATSEFKFDVNGQGEKWDGLGVETWRDDDVPRPHHPHAPPRIP